MIAAALLAAGVAGAWDGALCADRQPRATVGADVLHWMLEMETMADRPRLLPTAVDFGWSGYGLDLQASVPVAPCFRLGAREQVIMHNVYDDPPQIQGSEWHMITSAVLGAELDLPARFQVGAALLPGLRTVVVTQRTEIPERGLSASYSDVALVPTLYGQATVRWWATPWLAIHADTQLPLVNRLREAGWFPHRSLGAGVDVRWQRAEDPPM